MSTLVIGAGLSGLTAAYALKKVGKKVTVLEKTPRAGGAVRSKKIEGYLLELGPNTVRLQPEIGRLIRALKLEKETLTVSSKTPRYVQRNGRLEKVPSSPFSLIGSSLLSFSAKLRLLKEPLVSPEAPPNEDLFSFCHRRLGAQVAERLVAPFVSGVWAGDAHELEAASAFPLLAEWERRHGSVIKGAIRNRRPKGKTGLLSFRNGFETLTAALTVELKDELFFQEKVESIKRAGVEWVVTSNGQERVCSRVVFASPAHETAALIAPVSMEAAVALRIPYASVAVLHLGFEKKQIKRPYAGFGYLTLPSEKNDILGCLWSSNLFPGRAPDNFELFTVFMGGQTNPKALDLTDAVLIDQALAAIDRPMRIHGKPAFTHVARARQAIPQYTVGHADRIATLEKIERQNPGLFFIGNYRGGISVGDVIASALSVMNALN